MSKEMKLSAHWTQRSIADFIYNISSDFVAQLETRMEEKEITRSELASRLEKSNGRVSQIFNNPGNLSLRVIVELARVLGMKASIVAYDDGDPQNNKGPINPDVFVESWKRLNYPADLFELKGAFAKQMQANINNYCLPVFAQGFVHSVNSYATLDESWPSVTRCEGWPSQIPWGHVEEQPLRGSPEKVA